MNLGFAAGGAASPTPTPSPSPTAVGGRGKRKRYYVDIDGQQFPVADAVEAVSLLQRARAVAERQAEEKSARATRLLRKRQQVPQVRIATPAIEVSPEIRADVAPLVADISRLYEKAAVEAELALLMRRQMAEEDDEDEVIWLLL